MILHINTPEDLAKNLKELRKKYKVSQEELAKGIGKSYASILRYEKQYAQISVETAIKILQFFVNNHIKKAVLLSLSPTNGKNTISASDNSNNAIV